MNKRTHFFIKIHLSHFIRKGWCWLCVRGELETGTDCYILTQSSSDYSSTSFAFWLGCSTVGHWGPKPSVCRWLSIRLLVPQLTPTATGTETELTQAVCGTWLYNCLTSTCFLWAYASAPNSTTSTVQGDIPISSTGCTCFVVLPLIYTGASLDWRLGRGSICYNHPILIFQKSTREIFLHVRLHLPHTYILQIMLKDNNCEIAKRNYLNNSKNTIRN